jgi:hypothetical protein
MAESLYTLSTVMYDPVWLQFGRDMVMNLNLTRVVCAWKWNNLFANILELWICGSFASDYA